MVVDHLDKEQLFYTSNTIAAAAAAFSTLQLKKTTTYNLLYSIHSIKQLNLLLIFFPFLIEPQILCLFVSLYFISFYFVYFQLIQVD